MKPGILFVMLVLLNLCGAFSSASPISFVDGRTEGMEGGKFKIRTNYEIIYLDAKKLNKAENEKLRTAKKNTLVHMRVNPKAVVAMKKIANAPVKKGVK